MPANRPADIMVKTNTKRKTGKYHKNSLISFVEIILYTNRDPSFALPDQKPSSPEKQGFAGSFLSGEAACHVSFSTRSPT